jgi:2-polyprenyl-3-methyl-5-hydroxy-6-metoxy-1,4-benzoquinol methylase
VKPIPGLAPSVTSAALKPVACGLCGSDARNLEFRDEPFEVVTCCECGLTYVTPRLAEGELLATVYDEGYWASDAAKTRGYTDYRADAPLYLRTYRKRLPIVNRHFRFAGRVLDVGCAAGYFLRVMKDEAWEVVGLEPSSAIREAARELVGTECILEGTLDSAPLEPASFDLITLWDVIEHIPDPVAALRRVRELLAPGGKLLLETQNVASRAARVLGKRWQHYKHTEHLYHFRPETLAELLRRAGFRVLENSPRLGGKYVSLGFVAERAGRLSPVLSVLLSPLHLVGSRALYVNLLDEMVVVAEPDRD